MTAQDPPHGAGDGGDEPRVRDLLAHTPSVEDLARWFEMPSFTALAEGDVAAPPPGPTRAEEIRARRAQVLEHVDPALVARMDAHTEVARRFERRPLARPWLDGSLPTTFHADWIPEIPGEDDYPEVHIPAELRRDLEECTPQAFLRDLHRPEKDFYARLEPPWDDAGEEPPPLDPMAPVRETIRHDYRVGVHPPATTSMAASWSDLRALLARPWAEAKRERARRREAELLGLGEMGKDTGTDAVVPTSEDPS